MGSRCDGERVLVLKKMVAPSILSADFANLEKEIRAIMAAGADWVHVDVMDGHFVPNLTIGAPVVKAIRNKMKDVFLDCHLMIEEPERYVDDFLKAGASNITLHVESKGDIGGLLQHIQRQGCKAGLTLRPKTPIETLIPYLPMLDVVLVMTVEPGFGGQSFMTEQVAKISELRKRIDKNNFKALIEVDGGVNGETVKQLQEADVLVAGNFIFKGDYHKNIAALKGQE